MNVNDGTIQGMTEEQANALSDFIGVNKSEMTLKQEMSKRVSLHDHRSKLGKKLTNERSKRNIRRNNHR